MRMAGFAATETALRAGLPRSRRKVAMIAQAGLLMECFAEILCGRFPDYEILTCENLTDIPIDMVEDIRLVLVHHQDLSRIEPIVSYFKDETAEISIGVIVGGSDTAHPILRQLMESQSINGVLPLSLHLDVFLAGIELLAKGGEHFPSTLLQQARGGEMQVRNRTEATSQYFARLTKHTRFALMC